LTTRIANYLSGSSFDNPLINSSFFMLGKKEGLCNSEEKG